MNPHRRAALNKGGGLSLAAFMAAQSDGFWYDSRQTDRLFQENVGPTPANDPNEVIGLALSQRTSGGKTLAQVVDAATNVAPAFVAGGAGWSVSGSDGTHVATFGANSLRYQSDTTSPQLNISAFTTLTVGRTYRIEVECTAWTSGSLKTDAFGSALPVATGVGTLVFYGTASSTTLNLTRNAANVDLTIASVSVKEVTRYAAAQATTSLKPKFQTTGAAFDGSDDNLPTGYKLGATNNFMVAKVLVPATISGVQVIAGTQDAGAANKWWLGVTNTGLLRAGVGSQNDLYGSGDLRGQTVAVGLSVDGSTIRIFTGQSQVLTAAQSGAPSTATAIMLGALNTAGAAGNFFAGSIKSIVGGRQFLDLATFNQIASAL